MSNVNADSLQVICLCADWCGTCRDYRAGFESLGQQFPAARFHWMDIEERADELGDLDIEDFPTVLVAGAGEVLFYGTLLPHLSHLRRLIETLAEQQRDQHSMQTHSTAAQHREWRANADLARLARSFAHG